MPVTKLSKAQVNPFRAGLGGKGLPGSAAGKIFSVAEDRVQPLGWEDPR